MTSSAHPARTIFSRPTPSAPTNSSSEARAFPTPNSHAIRDCSSGERSPRRLGDHVLVIANFVFGLSRSSQLPNELVFSDLNRFSNRQADPPRYAPLGGGLGNSGASPRKFCQRH